MSDVLEVQLSRVVIQEKDDDQFIHLQEKDGSRSFPILIGFSEAKEIQRKLCGIETMRPLTHELITRILTTLDFQITKVIISDLRDSTFFATLVLRHDGEEDEKYVDCRPSDAIALALQTGVPVFVARKVLDMVAPE